MGTTSEPDPEPVMRGWKTIYDKTLQQEILKGIPTRAPKNIESER